MSKEFKVITHDISQTLKQFQKSIPATMQGFHQMATATHSDGALSKKQKELIATAIAVAARCEGCLGFHAKACISVGVTLEEFQEMLQVAMYMGGGPAVMTAAEAMAAYEEFSAG